jgi:transcriptional regulator with XRE-family HTH domain
MNKTTDVFSKNLLKLRKDNNLSQEEMGAIGGVTRQSYSGYEKGEIAPPFPVVAKYADHFKVAFEWFVIDHTDTREPKPFTDYAAPVEIPWSFVSESSPFPANNPHDVTLYYQMEVERLRSQVSSLKEQNKMLLDTIQNIKKGDV